MYTPMVVVAAVVVIQLMGVTTDWSHQIPPILLKVVLIREAVGMAGPAELVRLVLRSTECRAVVRRISAAAAAAVAVQASFTRQASTL